MITGVARFEPSHRDRRACNRFKVGTLSAPGQALVQAMAGAWFSLFRMAGRRRGAGPGRQP